MKKLVFPKPFLKWAGGKTNLLGQYEPLFPEWSGDYFEPFIGSGAVFFYLSARPEERNYYLSDLNQEIVDAFCAVRDDVEGVIKLLAKHQQLHSKDYFYQVRGLVPQNLSALEKAARTIYLNKTCFNGLYRVNKKGEFNVPMGNYKKPSILQIETLKAASRALSSADLSTGHYSVLVDKAQAGDFIYLDPPYHPLSKTAMFTNYVAQAFGEKDQIELAEVANALSKKGCLVMESNSNTDFIKDLYKGFKIQEVWARRSINREKSKRGAITELVVTNF
ncbi:MAG: DNA adenine methylase [Dehalococcoidia bacterium]|nr:DNA adenine methylase [Dehalococcoidia bacterium]